MRDRSLIGTTLILVAVVAVVMAPRAAAQGVDRDAEAALQSLYQSTPAAKTLAETAKGILVFPKIKKAGFIVGAQYGQGVLFRMAARSVTIA